MAILSIDIPDGFTPQALIYIPLYLQYRDEIMDVETREMVPNPESKVACVKRALRDHLREMYRGGKIMSAQISLDQVGAEADEESEVITVG